MLERNEFSENSIRYQSRIVEVEISQTQPTYFEAGVTTNELIDSTDFVQFGGPRTSLFQHFDDQNIKI